MNGKDFKMITSNFPYNGTPINLRINRYFMKEILST